MTCILIDRMKGSFIGGIVGDAFGSPHEFKPRDSYTCGKEMKKNKLLGSDSSMMLCLANSLIEKKRFDPTDQIEKYYALWKSGYMSRDIETTTTKAISFYETDKKYTIPLYMQAYYGLTNETCSGNGGILRLCPIPIFFFYSVSNAVEYSKLSSKVTHASIKCLDAAQLMGLIIFKLLQGDPKESIFNNLNYEICKVSSSEIIDIAKGTYTLKSRSEIRSSGYVVHSLEAALWSFYSTNTFEDGMILCGNLGGDVDSICCIYGQIAGSYYTLTQIPKSWVKSLQSYPLIDNTLNKLIDCAFISSCLS